MSLEEYRKAYRLGRRVYRNSLSHGESPFLPVLEHILQHATIVSQQPLGVVEIPLELVIGTYYSVCVMPTCLPAFAIPSSPMNL